MENKVGMGYKVIYEGGIAETEEKKSKFVAYVEPVESEEEVSEFIERIKKKNWNATHNCVAAVVGRNNEFSRCSDDGEPAGTAGKPMLEVLLGEGVHDVAVVVTRYFGGTLLGTGGLVRAYQGAVKAGLAASKVIEKNQGAEITIETDYNGIGKIQYIAGQMKLYTMDTEYSDVVKIKLMVNSENIENCVNKITEATAGKANIQVGDIVSYGIADGELIL